MVKMNPAEELEELIKELAYQDHANDTNFSEQLTQVFIDATCLNMKAEDIKVELDNLQLIDQIVDDEQLVVVHRVLERLPIVISEFKSSK